MPSLLAYTGIHQLLRGMSGGPEITLESVFLTLAFATIYSYAIALGYRLTYQGEEYNRNFAHSIIILGTLVSLVIAVIGDNIARALGVFGAFSIIRYRVPIRDPKDVTYILASVVVGLATGVGEILEAGLATMIILLLVFVLYWFPLGLGMPFPEPSKKKKKKKDKEANDAADKEKNPPAVPSPTAITAEPPGEKHENHKHKKKKNHREGENDARYDD